MNASPGKKILLVDDDEALRQSPSSNSDCTKNSRPSNRGNGGDGLEVAKQEYFDAILLDVGLPDMDGREVCRLMRRNGVKSPIIMLTAAESDADTILGLDAGANDYVTKPFKLGVLLARLRAQLRQHEQSEDAVFTIGPYTFRPSAKLLVHGETKKKIRLTEKETAILKYLTGPGTRWSAAIRCWARSGATTPRSPPHPGNPRLSLAPEDRARSLQRRDPGDRTGRLSPRPLRRSARDIGPEETSGEFPYKIRWTLEPHYRRHV